MILLSATRADKARQFVVVVSDMAEAEDAIQDIQGFTIGEATTYGVRFTDLASKKPIQPRLIRTWAEEAI